MKIDTTPINSIVNLIDTYHAEIEDKPRRHLGASILGSKCDRYLWLTFRWAIKPQFEGRIIRLFRRGWKEEDVVIQDLLNVGVEVKNYGKSQLFFYFAPHVGGSVDGIIERGLPESDKKHILEIKTHSLKSFEDLIKNGVEKSKYMHFVQMQLYMHAAHIDRALYFAVCKDDDRIYTERVKYDIAIATKYIERGKRIVSLNRIPEPINTDPTYYECKFCDAYKFCFETKKTELVNCRTCCHSTPTDDNTWKCEKFNCIVDENAIDGCNDHVIHPDLVNWKLIEDKSTQWSACYEIDGQQVLNGEGGKPSWYLLLSKAAQQVCDTFGAQPI